MKSNNLTVLISQIPRIACFSFAGILAYHNIPNWGWFLFVGLLLGFSISDDKEDK